jgi:hypothetical protein
MSGAAGAKGDKTPATAGEQLGGRGAGVTAGGAAGSGGAQPEDVRKVVEVLKTMGVTSYEPRVLNQIMELVHMFVSDVLADARVMAHHRRPADAAENRPSTLVLDDVKLALKMKSNRAFLKPPTTDLQGRLAKIHANPATFGSGSGTAAAGAAAATAGAAGGGGADQLQHNGADSAMALAPLFPEDVQQTLMALNYHLDYFGTATAASPAQAEGGGGVAPAAAGGGAKGKRPRPQAAADDDMTNAKAAKQGNFNAKVAEKTIDIKVETRYL